jgi:hypothetical protein
MPHPTLRHASPSTAPCLTIDCGMPHPTLRYASPESRPTI